MDIIVATGGYNVKGLYRGTKNGRDGLGRSEPIHLRGMRFFHEYQFLFGG
jgi:hypothetical protein